MELKFILKKISYFFVIEGNYAKIVFKSMGYYDTKARSIIVKMRAVLAHNLRLELAFE